MARFASSQGSSEPQALKPQDSVTVEGATPKITIGDADAEDTMLIFDGNAQDFYIALDDSGASADDLVIGTGQTAGTNPLMTISNAGNVGIGVVDPDSKLEILSTSSQLKLSYDASNASSFVAGNDGGLTINVGDSGLMVKGQSTGAEKPATLTLQSNEAIIGAYDTVGAIKFQAAGETGTDAIAVCAEIGVYAEAAFDATNNPSGIYFMTAVSEDASNQGDDASMVAISSTGNLTLSAQNGYKLQYEDKGPAISVGLRRGSAAGYLMGIACTIDNGGGENGTAIAAGHNTSFSCFRASVELKSDDQHYVDGSNRGTSYNGYTFSIEDRNSANASIPSYGYVSYHSANKVPERDFQVMSLDNGQELFSIVHDSGNGTSGNGTIRNGLGNLTLDVAGILMTAADTPSNSALISNGFCYQKRVLKVDAGGGDASVTLDETDSGSVIVCAPGANSITITLPAAGTDHVGLTYKFVIDEADDVQSGKAITIKTAGAGADNNDDLMGTLIFIGGTSAHDVAGDTFKFPASSEKGSWAEFTCVAGGANESWMVHAVSAGAVATVTD